ncbi:MAG TPA: hypothetical protein VEB88_02405 [Candidatus Acidoferrales bacterium]|nr:hypothetical protein [Candidatus Acidoferrales bacterium]
MYVKGNAVMTEVLANLQSIFSGVEFLGKAVEFGDKVAIAVYQFNCGTGGAGGGGGGGEGQTNSSVAFALGGMISPVAVVILSKDMPGLEGIKIHEFRGDKLGEGLQSS